MNMVKRQKGVTATVDPAKKVDWVSWRTDSTPLLSSTDDV